jgi:hypothetical protein
VENSGPTPSPSDPTAGLDELTVKSIRGLYGGPGREGTDERVWGDVQDTAGRERMLATAALRWLGEAHPTFNSKLFRRILTTVVEEQANGTRGSPTDCWDGWDEDIARREREAKETP